jgi:hypothetical protein
MYQSFTIQVYLNCFSLRNFVENCAPLVRTEKNIICANLYVSIFFDRIIAQAVSRWLPITAARLLTRIWSSGICGGQIGAGAGLIQLFRFPLQNFIPPNSPSSLSTGTITSGQ